MIQIHLFHPLAVILRSPSHLVIEISSKIRHWTTWRKSAIFSCMLISKNPLATLMSCTNRTQSKFNFISMNQEVLNLVVHDSRLRKVGWRLHQRIRRGVVVLGWIGGTYRVTHHVQNLQLSSKRKFCFDLARAGQAKAELLFWCQREVLHNVMGLPLHKWH